MSRHQIIRDLDYDDVLDEAEYHFEEDEEVGEEDKALMQAGTAQVREALGPQVSKVTVAQIEEALWHYYYDVDKSVAYLINKYIDPAPPKPAKKAPPKAETAGKKPAVPAKKKGASAVEDQLNKLKITPRPPSPPTRSKGLDVLAEFGKSNLKKAATFVVVGHVDAGKSTMMGRLLLDLGCVSQRFVDKLRREAEMIGKSSFALAWVLDQHAEERVRGVTMDIATNRLETDKTSFTILDAPGHRDFIPNMIAGASQADFAVLVIDADTGAFESGLKGQTTEHALLLRSMGVARVIVAVNKLDKVGWSEERFDEIKNQVSGFMSKTGFQRKKLAFVPVSGLHGDNLVRRSSDPAASWYTGPTLVEELDESEPNARALEKPLRMTVTETVKTPHQPLAVSGQISAGSLQKGDVILVQPSGETARIKALLVNDTQSDWAVAGQNVLLHIADIDPIHVRPGDIICNSHNPINCTDTFTLKALAFDFLMPSQVDVHRGRLYQTGTIQTLHALLDKVTGAITDRKPRVVKPGAVARITVKLEAKAPLEAGDRVILRSNGDTVAAGMLE